jgi:hypothetical protein
LGNIVAPLLAPTALVGVACFFSHANYKRLLSPFLTVKDGQLSWVALTFSIAALYEREAALRKFHHEATGIATTIAISALILACITPLFGMMFPTDEPSEQLRGVAWMTHYRPFTGSAMAALMATFALSGVHFGWLY